VTRRLVRVEDLLGRRVEDARGQSAGRIEEVRAEPRGDQHVVSEFLLGPGALLERLGIRRLFRRPEPLRVVRWDQIDLSRPDRPRLRCAVGDLEERARAGRS
jgi:hypothetical protein